MKIAVDNATMTKIIGNLMKMFEPDISNNGIPEFEYKEGLWVHNNRHSVTVVQDEKELELITMRDIPYILGMYKIDSAKEEGKQYLFLDAIKFMSKKYANEELIPWGNGKRSGLRNTSGNAITAEPTGVVESDAYNYLEILCKIELILLNIIHCRFGAWESKFYSDNNIDYIDILVMQLTREVITEYRDLVLIFEWLNINYVKDSAFLFNTPVTFIKNISGINEQEWAEINNLDVFINCFPIEDKTNTETWEGFLNRTCKDIQDCLIEQVIDQMKNKEHGSGWGIIYKYLTQENQAKNKMRIIDEKFFEYKYDHKWWKTWNKKTP